MLLFHPNAYSFTFGSAMAASTTSLLISSFTIYLFGFKKICFYLMLTDLVMVISSIKPLHYRRHPCFDFLISP